MLYRVEMNVLYMPGKISFVSQHVLPITVLPQSLFISCCTGAIWRQTQCRVAVLGKPRFHQPPTSCKVSVARWQHPDAMQMIRQHHHCIKFEGAEPEGPT